MTVAQFFGHLVAITGCLLSVVLMVCAGALAAAGTVWLVNAILPGGLL